MNKRQLDNRKKLEPFVEAYDRGDVFNRPLVESDLRERVAVEAGIPDASVSFRDEEKAASAILEKDDEKFSFTWVRWVLSAGGGKDREGGDSEAEREETGVTLTLDRLEDCIERALTLGPGYALDRIRIDFGENGTVSSAVLEGLLPVKKVESIKEAKK